MKFCLLIGSLIAAAEVVPTGLLGEIGRLSAVGVLGFIVVWDKFYGGPARNKALEKIAEALTELRIHCGTQK